MAQRREGDGTHNNGKAVGGQCAAGDHTDDRSLSTPPALARPLTRHDEEAFRDLLGDAATNGGVDMHLVERDYWMCQIASSLLSLESKRYPGSYTSIGGGSLLSLAGITERLSEDVDVNVPFVDGADACKPKWGKRPMEECQAQVEENLDIKGTRDPNGGGNYFRTVRYAYPSVLPQMGEERPAVKSDKGLRDAPREHLMRLDGVPYVGTVAQDQMSTLPLGPRVPMHDDLERPSIARRPSAVSRWVAARRGVRGAGGGAGASVVVRRRRAGQASSGGLGQHGDGLLGRRGRTAARRRGARLR